jgi:hypothetical protein
MLDPLARPPCQPHAGDGPQALMAPWLHHASPAGPYTALAKCLDRNLHRGVCPLLHTPPSLHHIAPQPPALLRQNGVLPSVLLACAPVRLACTPALLLPLLQHGLLRPTFFSSTALLAWAPARMPALLLLLQQRRLLQPELLA